MDDFNKFDDNQYNSKKCVALKTAYIHMADRDHLAGILLTQIVYWHLSAHDEFGEKRSRLKVFKEGEFWIAKRREDWWDECAFTPDQFDRAFDILLKKNLVIKKVFKFKGVNRMHVRLNKPEFIKSLKLHEKTEFPKNDCNSGKRRVRKFSKNVCNSGNNRVQSSAITPSLITESTYIETFSKEENVASVAIAPPPPPSQDKIIYSSLLTSQEVSSGIGKVIIPLEAWDKLVAKYGEARVLKSADDLSAYISTKPKKYRTHHIPLNNFIKSDLEKEAKNKPDRSKPSWIHPDGAGTHKFRPTLLPSDV